MDLRPYRDHDAAVTRAVFERAVRITAGADYTPEQVEAWATVGLDQSAIAMWAAARASAQTIIAVQEDEVVGFSDLVQGTLLDMLFVDPSVGRQGVGSALVRQAVSLAREGGAAVIETYASVTARPLFERHGFIVVKKRTPVVRGVVMTNFKLQLVL